MRWWTGKAVARVEVQGRSWCLAGSPAEEETRIRTGAAYQERLVEAGFAAIPEIRRTLTGDLIWSGGDRAWVLTGWVEGRPVLDQSRWTPQMLEQLGRAVGELHRLGRELIRPGAHPILAPAQYWAGDWRRFDAWARMRWNELMADGEVAAAPDLAPLRDVISAGVAALPDLPAPLVRRPTVVHGDLWTEHVLFTSGGRLSGFIDLDGLDVGDGVGELAALLSDFAQLDPDRCARVVGGYGLRCHVAGDDLDAAFATVIRHHVLALVERIARWSREPGRRADIVGPTNYWVESLHHAIATDRREWVSAVISRSSA